MKIGLKGILYVLYVGCKKLLQIPCVVKEYNPKFISDEVIYEARSDAYAIIVNYSRFGVSDDLLGLLRTLKAAGVNPVVVCNGRAKDAALASLKTEAHRVLVRRNVGRDFGAYRAASLYLHRSGLKVSRMLYFNDSVIYLPGQGLTSMVGKMVTGQSPVTGAFENHEFIHHIGSYAIAVGGEVFHDQQVQNFWQRYRPYDIRPHAIHKGEIGLSRKLKTLGYGIDVVYSVDQLATRMEAMEPDEILGLVKYMPTGWRAGFLDGARKRPFGAGTRIKGELLEGRNEGPGPRTPALSKLKTPGGNTSVRLDGVLRDLSKMALIESILSAVEAGSQIHNGFGVYHHLFGAPMVKKDLLQRGMYAEFDLRHVLGDLQDPLRTVVLRQLVNRGRLINMKGMRRFKVSQGLE